jgi:hypothetical protein
MRALAKDIPEFREAFQNHVADFGDVFCHALMEEFADFVVEALEKSKSGPEAANWTKSLKTGLDYLEQAYSTTDADLKKLINEAFLKNLWKAGTGLEDLKKLMGPNLKQGLETLD